MPCSGVSSCSTTIPRRALCLETQLFRTNCAVFYLMIISGFPPGAFLFIQRTGSRRMKKQSVILRWPVPGSWLPAMICAGCRLRWNRAALTATGADSLPGMQRHSGCSGSMRTTGSPFRLHMPHVQPGFSENLPGSKEGSSTCFQAYPPGWYFPVSAKHPHSRWRLISNTGGQS